MSFRPYVGGGHVAQGKALVRPIKTLESGKEKSGVLVRAVIGCESLDSIKNGESEGRWHFVQVLGKKKGLHRVDEGL
jgi:hypothetical protein